MVDRLSFSSLVRLLERFYSCRPAGIFTVLVGLTLAFSMIAPRHIFLSLETVKVLWRLGPERGIVAVGITALMVSGEFDLSVGSVSAFCSWTLASLYTTWGLHPALAAIVSLACGALVGGLNGLITVKLRIHSFIATLGTMMWWRGLLLLLSSGHPTPFRPQVTSPIFKDVLVGEVGGFPVQMLWYSMTTLILWILLEHTRLGNWVFATGGNRDAARAMGIDTDRVKVVCFTIGGFLCAFAGIMGSTRAGVVHPLQGTGMELEVLGAILVGGTLITGGVGSVVGTFLGLILVQIVRMGTVVMRISGYWFQVIVGSLIIAGVALNLAIERRRK